ncbi:hypothetical protein ACFYWX_32000 [Streptomyces sp. NPDC002888]|uniref:hypothetical protein n=1 Tax=Streptomyces sp. NPDC002888 TaxID=3364668 RepID=UPI0036736471
MSENASITELTSQYTAQVTADLERNAKEQERIGSEIAALQEQLAALQRDHTVLVSIQRAIDAAPAPAERAAGSDSVTVPTPRKKTAAQASSGRRERTKKAAAEPHPSPAGKPAARKHGGRITAAKKTGQPTLVDLVRRHLAEQSEPRSAAEVATALGQDHPERGIKTNVVRTTIEGLVAKSQAQRTKQGASVFYTAPDAPEQAAQSEQQPAPADA